jgi:hypothetical protein
VVKVPGKIEVPVPEERLVVQHVPVVKTKIVYRDRPTPAERAGEGEVAELLERAPETGAAPEVELVALNQVVRREIRPAAVVNAATGDAPMPTPLVGDGEIAVPDSTAETIMVAQTGSGMVEKGQGEDQ